MLTANDQIGERRPAIDVLHDDVRQPRVHLDTVGQDGVRVGWKRDPVHRFVDEAVDDVGLAQQRRDWCFQGASAVAALVAGAELIAEIDAAQAALLDVEHAIAAGNDVTGREIGCRRVVSLARRRRGSPGKARAEEGSQRPFVNARETAARHRLLVRAETCGVAPVAILRPPLPHARVALRPERRIRGDVLCPQRRIDQR